MKHLKQLLLMMLAVIMMTTRMTILRQRVQLITLPTSGKSISEEI